jgi:hypothetical protein
MEWMKKVDAGVAFQNGTARHHDSALIFFCSPKLRLFNLFPRRRLAQHLQSSG